jgi:AraC family transcriptional regulator
MREVYPLEAMSSRDSLRFAEVQDSSSYLRSLRSVASASMRVGHLVRQAMGCLETDRKAAWRCLSDASTLLGADIQELGVNVPSVDKLQPGGLATWQARRTLAYIEANLASKMDIDDLANLVALSRSHFSRAFKRSLGFSPMEYVIVRRVERAKKLISSTREPLAEVALACGFADQPHLNRRFRDIVGVSPGRWRRSNSAVGVPRPHCNGEVQTTGGGVAYPRRSGAVNSDNRIPVGGGL